MMGFKDNYIKAYDERIATISLKEAQKATTWILIGTITVGAALGVIGTLAIQGLKDERYPYSRGYQD
jgi:hypothetical protein